MQGILRERSYLVVLSGARRESAESSRRAVIQLMFTLTSFDCEPHFARLSAQDDKDERILNLEIEFFANI
jgi:hypothetical protein